MRIVDLFSGAGGLTFGFYYSLLNGNFVRNENNEILFANEFDHQAAEAFRTNYPDINMVEKDIKQLQEEEIRNLIGNREVDVVIGGPPCQSYSTIGKRVYDDKAKLYNEYYRILNIIRPRIFLFENVRGLLSMKDENSNSILDDIKTKFENIADDFGYHIYPDVLDAVHYGVPQHRERVFIIGIQKALQLEWTYPEKNNTEITLREAISDFPSIASGEEVHDYGNSVPVNDYQRLMRGNTQELTCHLLQNMAKKYRLSLTMLYLEKEEIISTVWWIKDYSMKDIGLHQATRILMVACIVTSLVQQLLIICLHHRAYVVFIMNRIERYHREKVPEFNHFLTGSGFAAIIFRSKDRLVMRYLRC